MQQLMHLQATSVIGCNYDFARPRSTTQFHQPIGLGRGRVAGLRPGTPTLARHVDKRNRNEMLVSSCRDQFGDPGCLRTIAKDEYPPFQQTTA
jgi:hypothetical protein